MSVKARRGDRGLGQRRRNQSLELATQATTARLLRPKARVGGHCESPGPVCC